MHPNPDDCASQHRDPTRRILQVGALLPWLEETLRERYSVEVLPRGPEAESLLEERGETFEAVVTTARVGVDASLMRRLPGVGAVVHFGVGYDSTDVAEARARGIGVSNTPDVLTDCVADFAVGGMVDVMRGLTAADRFVREGGWRRGGFALTTRIGGKRVGILGLGRIGQAVTRRLAGFNVEVGYHSRNKVVKVPYPYFASPAALAEWCDVLIVTTAGGAATTGLVSGTVLDALGPDGYLVNVSRGTVVDEPVLVDRLVRGRIAGAALDVFVDEPNVPEELLGLENVVLLPHIASGTRETRQAMAQLVLDNLARFLTDGTLLTPVPVR
jgi:hydroxypyruvate reductase